MKCDMFFSYNQYIKFVDSCHIFTVCVSSTNFRHIGNGNYLDGIRKQRAPDMCSKH